jgi:hypothetical protein
MFHSQLSSANQIKKREKENPDQIYNVPVKPHEFHGGKMAGVEIPALHTEENPGNRPHPDQNVDSVQAGHHEIEREEKGGIGRLKFRVRKKLTRV